LCLLAIIVTPNDAVEKPVEGQKQADSEGALPLPLHEIVEYRQFRAVDFSSFQVRNLKSGFFYSLNVELEGRGAGISAKRPSRSNC
jgi:hypothetical protein